MKPAFPSLGARLDSQIQAVPCANSQGNGTSLTTCLQVLRLGQQNPVAAKRQCSAISSQSCAPTGRQGRIDIVIDSVCNDNEHLCQEQTNLRPCL
jgi:hypothetical protein